MARSESIRVEVVYAERARQVVVDLKLPAGCTARVAVRASGLEGRFPAAGLHERPLGVFSRPVPDDHVLEDGDRVEIYRPLEVDPKAARRARAAAREQRGRARPR